MLASKKELGLEYVFRYPLTQVPLSLCCSDGMMAKTEKRSLFSLLKKVPQSSPGTVDAYVIDGQFLLHTIRPNIPGNYDGLAACILMNERARRKGIHYNRPLGNIFQSVMLTCLSSNNSRNNYNNF